MYVTVKQVKYHNTICTFWIHFRENKTTLKLLSDNQITENIIGNKKEEDETKGNNYVLSMSPTGMHFKQQLHCINCFCNTKILHQSFLNH